MTESRDPVLRGLTPDEQTLLAIVCEPFRFARQFKDGVDWPVWDYVARTLSRQTGLKVVPEELLAGLPVGTSTTRQTPYRLYWLGDISHDGVPGDGMKFGLTIAGMHAAREQFPQLGLLADELAAYVGEIAKSALELQPTTPFEVASWEASIPDLTGGNLMHGEPYPLTLPAAAVAAVLRNESAFVSVHESEGGWRCSVRGRSLRPFYGVKTAAEYLAVAWSDEPLNRDAPPASPLTLIQTIDYFGYVVKASKHWPGELNEHPVQLQSLSAAASLVLPALSKEEFENRVSSVCTVIDQFVLPEIPPDALKKRFQDQKGSVNQLTYFLEERVAEGPQLSNAQDAIEILRAVRQIRRSAQHDHGETRAVAAKARNRLGLSPTTQSWEHDWDVIRAQLASAFSRIIEALQATDLS